MRLTVKILTVALVVAACDGRQPDRPAPEIYAAAVAHPERTDADRARDAGRQPATVLEFFRIAPGMTVLDLYSGGGYYTELLSHVVGPQGRVTAHNNQAYLGFAGAEIEARYADDRLPNVTILMAENNELEPAAEAYDAVTMILTYHDMYYADPDNGWPPIDGARLLAELKKGLKPGGTVGIVDHHAEPGSPADTGGTTHRIDVDIVIREMQEAGFELDGSSDVLRNPEDDHSKLVFDPSVRGNTDRFVLRFVKPR